MIFFPLDPVFLRQLLKPPKSILKLCEFLEEVSDIFAQLCVSVGVTWVGNLKLCHPGFQESQGCLLRWMTPDLLCQFLFQPLL